MAYSGTGAPPGAITYVLPGDSTSTIQSKLNSVQPGNTLMFTSGAYDFGGTTITGKSGVTLWADGQVVIDNAPAAGTSGAFDFSGQSNWTIGGDAPGQGFVFQGSLINATNAINWAIGNSQFNNETSNGFDGSAIRMNGASFGTIINNDFTGVGGNVLGMYNLNNITIDGNHFTNTFEPISIQEPTTDDASLGNNIVIERNVFIGTQRAAVEIGPASSGSEHFSGLVISNNYFDNFNNTAGEGTLLAISAVGQSSQNTTITNNFINRGSSDGGDIGVAIEMTGTGTVSGNTIANFSYAALTYQSGWNVSGNTVYNDGASPYFGFANNGSGTGTFGPETELSGLPAPPAIPTRLAWGGVDGGSSSTGSTAPTVIEKLASDTSVPATDAQTADTNALAGLTGGTHTIGGSETDMVGAASTTSTLDAHGPVTVLNSAVLTNGQVTLTGRTDGAGDTVQVYEGYNLVGTAQTASNGAFTLVAPAASGVYHEYGAVAVDGAGNWGAGSNDVSPTTRPATTATTAMAGASATPSVTPNLVHDTSDSSTDAQTADANALAGLTDGTHTIGGSETDMAGTASTTSTLDAHGPVTVLNSAVLTNGQVTLTGSTDGAGDIVQVYEGYDLVGTVQTASNGAFTLVASAASGVYHEYGAVAVDGAGNWGAGSNDVSPTAGPATTTTTAMDSDVIVGNGGNDTIISGAGADKLSGGSSNVTFTYNAASDSATGSSDTITDFQVGSDKFDFTNIAGINATNGVPLFQGDITGTGNLTLNAHSVAYLEVGDTTQVLVNTSNAAETVSTSDMRSADIKIGILGVHLGLTATDFHHS